MTTILGTRASLLAPVAALVFAGAAQAEVRNAAPDSMQLLFTERVAATPSAVYAAIGQLERWWDGSHTYSGDAANLSLAMQPGGCWCERWAGGAVEHGRVIMLLKDQAVRVQGALGPLQVKAVNGVMTFALKAEDGGTALTLGYRVNGAAASALDKDASAVDGVLAIQVARLKRYVETGKPAP
ncbi:MAG TPA: ATPase [Casimicrobiaceae bacterium]|nr:ATPase [Casimicrobiaceae bacterium]